MTFIERVKEITFDSCDCNDIMYFLPLMQVFKDWRSELIAEMEKMKYTPELLSFLTDDSLEERLRVNRKISDCQQKLKEG